MHDIAAMRGHIERIITSIDALLSLSQGQTLSMSEADNCDLKLAKVMHGASVEHARGRTLIGTSADTSWSDDGVTQSRIADSEAPLSTMALEVLEAVGFPQLSKCTSHAAPATLGSAAPRRRICQRPRQWRRLL